MYGGGKIATGTTKFSAAQGGPPGSHPILVFPNRKEPRYLASVVSNRCSDLRFDDFGKIGTADIEQHVSSLDFFWNHPQTLWWYV